MLAAIACLFSITLGYSAVCAGSPFGRCRECNGFGFEVKTDRKGRTRRGKTCRRCHGHGIRLRTGRRLFNLAAGIYRDGNQ